MRSEKLVVTIKAGVVVISLLLFGLLLSRDYFVKSLEVKEAQVLARSSRESFMGIYFQNERIGYVENRFALSAEGITLQQNSFLLLNVLGQRHPVRMNGIAHLTGTYLLRDFTFHLEAPFYQMDAQGEVRGSDVFLSLATGKEQVEDVIHLQSPPYFSTNRRAYLLTAPLTVGRKIKIPYFDPVSMSGQNTIVQYRGQEKIMVNGQIHNLHAFTETFAGLRVKSWLNDQGEVVKEESPAGFVFKAEPEFKAKQITGRGSEILSAVSVPVKGDIADLPARKELRLRLSLPADGEFVLDKDRQSFDGQYVTIRREELPEATASVCSGQEDYLRSTPAVQAKNASITEVVQPLVDGREAVIEQVRSLAGWVFANLEKRPVLGIPDALTTLATRKGDCNEHAALFAAMARNAGIPSRIVAGVTFHQGAFYYHAWNEVCVGERWLSLDTTKNQLPADISHLKFVEGGAGQQVKIGALLGKLQIEIVE